jgi:hypothetical protein
VLWKQKMITANCRDRFTAADFEFVVRTLSASEAGSLSLTRLLTDAEARDAVLDHQALANAVLDRPDSLHISAQLYFYILVRHVLKETDLRERTISDYVASLLETFSQTRRLRSPADGQSGPIQYLSDMLSALQNASPTQAFLIRAHIGNYSLFLAGIFHETVVRRSMRGGPDIEFYERLGSGSYKALAMHRAAKSACLTTLYSQLADAFHELRVALNQISDRLLHFTPSPLLPSPGK